MADPGAPQTTATLFEGSATVSATFAKKQPKILECSYRQDSGFRLKLGDAHLTSVLQAIQPQMSESVEVVIGRQSFTIPTDSWIDTGTATTSQFTPGLSEWQDSQCTITLDKESCTWSLDLSSVEAIQDVLWDLTDGEAVVALNAFDESATVKAGVSLMATLIPSDEEVLSAPAGESRAAAASPFRNSRLLLRVDPGYPANSVYRLTRVQLPSTVLEQDAVAVTIGDETFEFTELPRTPTRIGVIGLDDGGSATLVIRPTGVADLIVTGRTVARLGIRRASLTVEGGDAELFREAISMAFATASASMLQ